MFKNLQNNLIMLYIVKGLSKVKLQNDNFLLRMMKKMEKLEYLGKAIPNGLSLDAAILICMNQL
jgi:hypothetical protein